MVDAGLAHALGHGFRNADLLRQALTHRSFGQPHNERLEFVGDAVLNCVIAAELFQRFGAVPEGDLSRLRAALVNQTSLAERASSIALSSHVRLGAGEVNSGGDQRPSMLADALEALIGAVFIDGGYEEARAAVLKLFGAALDALDPLTFGKDAKTALQEWLQGRRRPLPEYRLLGTSGVAHRQQFQVECIVAGLNIRTSGTGPNRRIAEQVAARAALTLLDPEGVPE
jgi:ribonuclease-3